jgi:hypothetical protein
LTVRPERGELTLEWKSSGGAPWQWVVQKKVGNNWTAEILPAETTSETIKADLPQVVAVAVVNRYGTMSSPATYISPH